MKNLSYKQLQELVDKQEKEIEGLKSILDDIFKTMGKYLGFPKDQKFIVLN